MNPLTYHGESREDSKTLALLFRRSHSIVFLSCITGMYLFLCCIAAVADVAGVYHALYMRYLDPMGNFSGSRLELLAISLMTLFAYILIGVLYQKNLKWPAAALYVVVLGLLAMSLWSTEVPRFEEIWSGGAQMPAFQGQASAASVPADAHAPWAFLLLCDLVFAFCYTLAGLVFLWTKAKLMALIPEWRLHAGCRTILAQHHEAANLENNMRAAVRLDESLKSPEECRRIAWQVARCAVNQYRQIVLQIRNENRAALEDVRTSYAERKIAENTLARAEACLSALEPAHIGLRRGRLLMGVVLLCAWHSHPARAESTAELCAQAPVFQLLIDASKSSPVRDPGFIAAAEPLVERKLRALPPCSQVLIATVGDASVIPVMLHTRIQMRTTRDGATVDDAARSLRRLLAGMPERIDSHDQLRSELLGGLADAARNVNPQARRANVIVMLTDLVEESALANCRVGECRLPAPGYRLANTEVTVYGAGLGLPSNRALSLTAAWERFFAKAGVKPDLRRTF